MKREWIDEWFERYTRHTVTSLRDDSVPWQSAGS